MRHRLRRPFARTLVACAAAAVGLAGCGGGGTAEVSEQVGATTGPAGPTTTPRPAVTTTDPRMQVGGVRSTRLDDLRGRTVCELDLVHRVDAVVVADVYTTATVSDCDETAFAAVDTKAVAREQGVGLVLRNGPRVWVVDALTTTVAGDGASIVAGGLEFAKGATVELDAVSSQQPYEGYTLQRDAVAVFAAGRRVYELREPRGHTWVMQSFSTRVDPSTTVDNLDALGERLHLPKGWTFSSRVLDGELRIEAPPRRMRVLQDDFANSYVRADS